MGIVHLVDPSTGDVHAFDEAADANAIATATRGGWQPESAATGAARAAAQGINEAYSGLGDKARAALGSLASGATAGVSDAALGLLAPDVAREQARQRAANPITSTVANVAGAIAPVLLSGGTGAAADLAAATPTGMLARVGSRIAASGGEEAGVLSRLARGAAGGIVEGAGQGAGQGLSDVALSEEPLDVEHAVSTISSKALLGAGIGGVAGTLGKGVELGLAKGKAALDAVAAEHAAAGEVAALPEDLGALVARGDKKALDAAATTERDAIETARVPQRKELADEIGTFRREQQAQHEALSKLDVDLPAVEGKAGTSEIVAAAEKANRKLDGILENPIELARKPEKALGALESQDAAWSKLMDRSEELRTALAKSPAQAAALDTVEPMLERNRALQSKIADLTGEASSPRLTQISAAKEALEQAAKQPETAIERMVKGSVFSAVAGAVHALPIPGSSLLATLAGAKASGFIGEKVFGRLGEAIAAGQAHTAQTVGKFLELGTRATKIAPPIATRVLSRAAFGPALPRTAQPEPEPKDAKLPEVFAKRSAELRDQVAMGPDGKAVTRPAARERIAKVLAPIAAHQPVLADRMETLAARRLEFLANKLPRRPEIGGVQIGPDHWRPSDMEMRTWARYVAAAEDPDGIMDRLAHGTVSPEDGEVMRELYPERLADLTRQILEQLPTLRSSLPYQRQISLSMLSGVPVDPSMEPRIVAALQAPYAAEPEPPKAVPQFGSVSTQSEIGTLSERRERGTA